MKTPLIAVAFGALTWGLLQMIVSTSRRFPPGCANEGEVEKLRGQRGGQPAKTPTRKPRGVLLPSQH